MGQTIVLGSASGNAAVALGTSTANGDGAVGIGKGNVANGRGAVAIGDPNTATGVGAVAIGTTTAGQAGAARSRGGGARRAHPGDLRR
ncbi:MAG: hypothetical protein IPF48_00670 [Sphingomonadales bacterium]|nr:hypothetical protein [Sphingomonadales bacterium]